MKSGDYIGIKVNPIKAFSVGVCLFPGSPLGTNRYTADDTFVIEYDFRYAGEEDGIHLGCPNGDWIAITAERFSEYFGNHMLEILDGLAVVA